MTDPVARSRELEVESRRLAGLVAETAELSVRVHDEVAEVHDAMGGSAELDPAAMREHADRDRDLAERERRVASGEVPVSEGMYGEGQPDTTGPTA